MMNDYRKNEFFYFNKLIFSLTIIALFTICSSAYSQGLRASGKKIVDENNNEVILRGMGLGGWMLQEPYMMEMSGIAGNQTQIRAKIESVIGASATQVFYNKWLENHCTKKDIDSMASWGFNSIRLPMHYNLFTLPIESEPVSGENTWIEKGFVMVDSLLKWCEANEMYLILDLHAAPGGQGRDAAISDYNSTKPSLWESEANKQKTIALWKKLAERYVNEPWIGGYDLINEPNWNFVAGQNQNGCSESSNIPLRQLLVDITSAIRQVDTKHMIIIEGNCWGNNYNGVLPPWDQNMVLSFHKYWSNNDIGSIQGIINLRNQYNIPIWLGESGENSNAWFTDAIKLVEDNDIGWAWWPLKKIGSVVNPLTIVKTVDYQNLLNYWKTGANQPTATQATNTLMQIAENAKLENCVYRKDVVDAMFRQIEDISTKPYADNVIPGVINATDFDLGRYNQAYFDTESADYHVTTGTYTSWNNGWVYRNDGVDIEPSTDSDFSSNHFNIGWTADNEWFVYTVKVDSTAAYSIQIRYSSSITGASIRLQVNDTDVSSSISLASTGGNQSWSNKMLNDIMLYKGINKLKVYIDKGGINLGFLKFSISRAATDVLCNAIQAETYNKTELIHLDINKRINESSLSQSGFSCTVNGSSATINSIALNPLNPTQIIVSLAQPLYDIDNIKLSYSAGQVAAIDGTLLQSFSDLSVKNNLPVYYAIPGKIEAESFNFNQGLVLETCTDIGGGQDIGYTNTGDYVDYPIRVNKDAKYDIELRVASAGTAGRVEFQQLSLSNTLLNSVTVSTPVTGGWQSWRSITSSINLSAGIGKLRVKILQPEFNLNWYKFSENFTGIPKTINKELLIFPNPAYSNLTIQLPEMVEENETLVFRNLTGSIAKIVKLSINELNINVFVGDLNKGLYIIELKNAGSIYRSKLIIE